MGIIRLFGCNLSVGSNVLKGMRNQELFSRYQRNLKVVHWQNREFRFNQPLTLQPALDEESSQLYVVEAPDLTLLAYAQTREQLLQEIGEQIAFMWDTYVKESEDKLAPDALRLRQRLLEDVWEVSQDAA